MSSLYNIIFIIPHSLSSATINMMSHKEEATGMLKERLQNCIQGAFLSMAISTGVKLGLFDLMASFTEPKSAKEIATCGHFKERYINDI